MATTQPADETEQPSNNEDDWETTHQNLKDARERRDIAVEGKPVDAGLGDAACIVEVTDANGDSRVSALVDFLVDDLDEESAEKYDIANPGERVIRAVYDFDSRSECVSTVTVTTTDTEVDEAYVDDVIDGIRRNPGPFVHRFWEAHRADVDE